MKSKAQIAIEFLIVFSFILIVFLFLFSLITQQRAVIANTQTYSQLQLVAQSIALQISRAVQAGNGYSAQLPLLTSLGVTPYNVSVTSSGTVIVTSTTAKQAIRTTAFSNSQLSSNSAFLASGSNTVYNLPISNGSIYLQNSYGTICVDSACPTTTNQSASISLSTQMVQAPLFNGASYITAPSNSVVTGSKDRTVSFWLRTGPSFVPGGPEPFSWGTESSGTWFGIAYPDSGAQSRLDVADWAVADHDSATYLQANRWYYITVTLSSSGTVFGLYINGVSDANFPVSTTALNTASTSLYIGDRNDLCTCANLPQGSSVVNFQIYSNTLSSNQIYQLYNEGITGQPIPGANVMGWWPLNGNVNDYSGNGNNGAINNGLIFSTASQITASVKNPLGRAVNNVLVGFATTLGNFTNGYGTPGQAVANYTNQNGIVTTFLNEQGNSGQAIVKASAFNGNLTTSASLLQWYPFNLGQGANALDISGNKNNGAFVGQPSWSNPNYITNFNGQSSYMVASPPTNIAPSTFTISAWINVRSGTHNAASCCGIRQEAVDIGVQSSAEGSDIMDAVSDGGLGQINGFACLSSTCWTQVVSPSNILTTGNWYLETMTYDGSNLRIWLNGVMEGNVVATGTMSTTSLTGNQVYFGTRINDGSYYNGSMANVQTYNTALSANQIVQLYNSGISAAPLPNSGLTGWWPLSGNANDYSGNNYNATIYSTTSFAPAVPTIPPQLIANANASRVLTASFTGTNSYVLVGNVSRINSLSNWSVSFWMNSTALYNYHNPFDANFVPAGNNAGPRFEQGDEGGLRGVNALALLVGTSGSNYNIFTYANAISANTWYQVIAARSGNTIIGYLNGIMAFNNTNTKWPSAFPNVTIGRGFANSAARQFLGNISDVQIYNQTLSLQQASQLYREGISGVPLPGTKLVGWWPLSGNSSDFSLNSNNGLAVNVVYKNAINYIPSLIPSLNYSGVNFNGQSSYIKTGNTNFPTGSSARSLFAWVYFSSVTGGCCNNPTISFYGTESSTEASILALTNGKLIFGGWSDDYASTLQVKPGAWHFVGYTYSAGSKSVTLWVDGKSQTGSLSGGSALNTVLSGNTDIGVRYDCTGSCTEMNGTVADFQVYNTNLTSSQVQQLYKSQIPPSASATLPLSWYP